MIEPAGRGAVLGLPPEGGVPLPSLVVGKVNAPFVPQAVSRVLPSIKMEQIAAARFNKGRMFQSLKTENGSTG